MKKQNKLNKYNLIVLALSAISILIVNVLLISANNIKIADINFSSSITGEYRLPKSIDEYFNPINVPYFMNSERRLVSSFDRTGGNNDGTNFIRIAGDKYVLMEETNKSGYISRIWMAGEVGSLNFSNPRLEIYIDSESEPIFIDLENVSKSSIDINKNNLYFDSKNSSGGLVSYFPIKFNNSIKVLSKIKPNYYQIDYNFGGNNNLNLNKIVKIADKWSGDYMGKTAEELVLDEEVASVTYNRKVKISPKSSSEVFTVSNNKGTVTGIYFPKDLIEDYVNDLWIKVTYPNESNNFAYFPLNLIYVKNDDNYVVGQPPTLSSEIDSYVISPSGKEIIIKGDRVWIREPYMENPDRVSQGGYWYTMSLNEYFRGRGDLPPSNIESYAIGPNGNESVLKQGKFWGRSSINSSWNTGRLEEYWNSSNNFTGNVNNKNIQSINYLGHETIIWGNRFWFRKTWRDRFWIGNIENAWGFIPKKLIAVSNSVDGERVIADNVYRFRQTVEDKWQTENLSNYINKLNPYKGSIFFGQKLRTGEYYLTWPIPYQKGIKIEIENKGINNIDTNIVVLNSEKNYMPSHSGYFTVKYENGEEKSNNLHVAADIKGLRGKLVGLVLKANGSPNPKYGRTFLEGDELIYVDGQKIGNGTGIEDIFNGGWFFIHGPFIQPMHGVIKSPNSRLAAPRLDAIVNTTSSMETIMYRHYLIDAINFENSFKLELEYGPTPGYRKNRNENTNFESITIMYLE